MAPCNITVRTLSGRDFKYTLTSDMTVEAFKDMIGDDVGVEAARQRLIFHGKVLRDEQMMFSYELNDKAIHLVERPIDTPQSQSSSSTVSTSGETEGRRRARGGGSGSSRGGSGTFIFESRSGGSGSSGRNNLGPIPEEIEEMLAMGMGGQDWPREFGVTVNNGLNRASERIRVARKMLNLVADTLYRLDHPEAVANNTQLNDVQFEGGLIAPPSAERSSTSDDSAAASSNGATGDARQQNQPAPPLTELAPILTVFTDLNFRLNRYICQMNEFVIADPASPTAEQIHLMKLVPEAMHHMSHAMHHISDLEYNLLQTAPRTIDCSPQSRQSTAFVTQTIPIHVNLEMPSTIIRTTAAAPRPQQRSITTTATAAAPPSATTRTSSSVRPATNPLGCSAPATAAPATPAAPATAAPATPAAPAPAATSTPAAPRAPLSAAAQEMARRFPGRMSGLGAAVAANTPPAPPRHPIHDIMHNLMHTAASSISSSTFPQTRPSTSGGSNGSTVTNTATTSLTAQDGSSARFTPLGRSGPPSTTTMFGSSSNDLMRPQDQYLSCYSRHLGTPQVTANTSTSHSATAATFGAMFGGGPRSSTTRRTATAARRSNRTDQSTTTESAAPPPAARPTTTLADMMEQMGEQYPQLSMDTTDMNSFFTRIINTVASSVPVEVLFAALSSGSQADINRLYAVCYPRLRQFCLEYFGASADAPAGGNISISDAPLNTIVDELATMSRMDHVDIREGYDIHASFRMFFRRAVFDFVDIVMNRAEDAAAFARLTSAAIVDYATKLNSLIRALAAVNADDTSLATFLCQCIAHGSEELGDGRLEELVISTLESFFSSRFADMAFEQVDVSEFLVLDDAAILNVMPNSAMAESNGATGEAPKQEPQTKQDPQPPTEFPMPADMPAFMQYAIRRDRENLNNAATRPPLSDAYISGCPVKRRRLIDQNNSAFTDSSFAESFIADTVVEAAVNSNIPTAPSLRSQILEDVANDSELQSAFEEQIVSLMERRLADDPNYEPNGKHSHIKKKFDERRDGEN